MKKTNTEAHKLARATYNANNPITTIQLTSIETEQLNQLASELGLTRIQYIKRLIRKHLESKM